jgi:hypothetical protein
MRQESRSAADGFYSERATGCEATLSSIILASKSTFDLHGKSLHYQELFQLMTLLGTRVMVWSGIYSTVLAQYFRSLLLIGRKRSKRKAPYQ